MNANSPTVAPKVTPASWLDRCYTSQGVSQARRNKTEANAITTAIFDSPWVALAESLREGVVVVSRDLKPIYLNQQAAEICQKLSIRNRHFAGLPTVISEICHRLIRNGNSPAQPIISECQTVEEQTIRMRASWVSLGSGNGDSLAHCDRQYMLIFLENRDRILQEELEFEQQKYQLTDREIEIWSLLRQEHSYQEIAETLHISLNTVKTHVKNIYAKKRWNQVKETTEEC